MKILIAEDESIIRLGLEYLVKGRIRDTRRFAAAGTTN